MFEWLMNNGTVLNGTVVVRLLFIGLCFEIMGIVFQVVSNATRPIR